MARDFNNPLLPGYTKAVKTAKANGSSPFYEERPDFLNTGSADQFAYGGSLLDKNGAVSSGWRDWVGALRDNPSAQEAYKNHYNAMSIDDRIGSGPTVPGQPMVGLDGNIVYPWDNGYDQLFRNIPTEFGDKPDYINPINLETPKVVSETTLFKPSVPVVGLNDTKVVREESNFYNPYENKLIELNPTKVFQDSFTFPEADDNTPGVEDGASEGGAQSQIEKTINDSILNVLNGGDFPGMASAVSGQRDALAAYTKDLQAKTALSNAKAGSIGQGSSYGAQNAVRKGILGALAQSEQGISNLKAQQYEKALNVGRGNLEFDKTFGLQEKQLAESGRQADLRTLQSMASDNPVLQSKLMNSILKEQKMEYTEEELGQLKTYFEEKKTRDEALDAAELEILKALPDVFKKQIENILEPTTGEKIKEGYQSDLGLDGSEADFENLSNWSPDQWSEALADPDAFEVLKETIPSFDTPLTSSKNFSDFEKLGLVADKVYDEQNDSLSEKSAGEGSGSIIIYNGRPMRVVSFSSEKRGSRIFSGRTNTQRNVVIEGVYLDESGSSPVKIGGTDGWVNT